MELAESGFCIKGEFVAPCKELTFYEFPDEKEVIVLILEYFKRFLPQIAKKKTDYYNKPIIVNPKDITVVYQGDAYGDYVAVLGLVDDNSTYPDDSFYHEETNYVFQVDLQVTADDALASLENLIKLKSIVKTLLVNMDNNLQLITTMEGFSWGNYGINDSNKYIRQGTQRFSIQSTNIRK